MGCVDKRGKKMSENNYMENERAIRYFNIIVNFIRNSDMEISMERDNLLSIDGTNFVIELREEK